LRAALAMLRQRTAAVQAASKAIAAREAALGSREAAVSSREAAIEAMVDRCEALAAREASLRASVEVLQTLASATAHNPHHGAAGGSAATAALVDGIVSTTGFVPLRRAADAWAGSLRVTGTAPGGATSPSSSQTSPPQVNIVSKHHPGAPSPSGYPTSAHASRADELTPAELALRIGPHSPLTQVLSGAAMDAIIGSGSGTGTGGGDGSQGQTLAVQAVVYPLGRPTVPAAERERRAQLHSQRPVQATHHSGRTSGGGLTLQQIAALPTLPLGPEHDALLAALAAPGGQAPAPAQQVTDSTGAGATSSDGAGDAGATTEQRQLSSQPWSALSPLHRLHMPTLASPRTGGVVRAVYLPPAAGVPVVGSSPRINRPTIGVNALFSPEGELSVRSTATGSPQQPQQAPTGQHAALVTPADLAAAHSEILARRVQIAAREQVRIRR
jgi:hypothetical protein